MLPIFISIVKVTRYPEGFFYLNEHSIRERKNFMEIEKSENGKMKKKIYQKPEIEVIAVKTENMICVSGKIGDWKLDEDTSDDDDWSDQGSSDNAKSRNLWEK